MASKNRHRYTLAIVEVAAASMVSERQIADELEKVDDVPEEEVNPFGSVARHTSLDPKSRVDRKS